MRSFVRSAMDKPYNLWCRQMCRSLPALGSLFLLIPDMSLLQRKAVLTATRVQSYPEHRSRLYTAFRDVWASPVSTANLRCLPDQRVLRHGAERLDTLLKTIQPFLESSITSGLISAVVRSAPINDIDPFLRAKDDGLWKELDASIHVYHPSTFSFSCIFSESPTSRPFPIAKEFDGNPVVAEDIHQRLLSLRRSMHNSTLFPKLSHKSVGTRYGHLSNTSSSLYE
jgi:hypothetical protein